MDYNFSELLDQSRQWVTQAVAAGWLSDRDLENVNRIDSANPASLFYDSVQRPLVVAFFGGTGVGKSSLLNRLAGQNIAQTGVERPTSREISAFVHQSVTIAHLPSDFPTEKIKIAHHDDDQKKSILWIDMPDIDSTERKNREIVFAWLPHIDVLVYVVSPERYRDNAGWRLLLSHGHDHAWLFVMNQWDKGSEVQFEDLKRQIEKAGFQDAIILRTDCLTNSGDEFDSLESTIASLAQSNSIKELERRGFKIRKQHLADTINKSIEGFGPEDGDETLSSEWRSKWEPTKQAVRDGLAWPIQQIAGLYVSQGSKLLQRKESAAPKDGVTTPPVGDSVLWDDWAQTRLEDAFDNLLVKSSEINVPIKPLKKQLTDLRQETPALIHSQTEQSLRTALANPGTRIQRFLLVIMRMGSMILPLAALSWVGYRLFNTYYQSGVADGGYLGINFAIHSALLVLTSWLLPWFLHRKLKPSTERTAVMGLKRGLDLALDQIAAEVEQSMDRIHQEKQLLIERGRKLTDECGESDVTMEKTEDSMLGRVLRNV